MEATSDSLFERIGGMDAVDTAVDIFYEKITADPLIDHFFTDIDMGKQSTKLKSFLAYAFGAPIEYTGKEMHEAHAHMKIQEEHFDAVAGHLSNTLQELKLDPEIIREIMAIAAGTKADIVNT